MEKPYNYIDQNTQNDLRIIGRDSRTGVDIYSIKTETMPLADIEKKYITDCDTLAGMFDGTITDSDHFFDGRAKYEGLIDHAIYLDKSARPVRFLMHELWSELSNEKFPESSFRNVDKGSWRSMMSKYTENVDNPSLSEISLSNHDEFVQKLDTPLMKEHLARIRATYLDQKYIDQISDDAVEEAWNYPTVLDGKHVAIVDEVKSSGATLKIADMLFSAAIPEAKFEPVYWSVPHRHQWITYDKEGNPIGEEFAVSTVPAWYDSSSSYGRGIGELNPQLAERSKSKVQRLGKYILSNPLINKISLEREPIDQRSRHVREDLRTLASRFKQGRDVVKNYTPSPDREQKDYEQRIENYYQVSFKDWLSARRKK